MPQHYSDPKRESDPHALPDLEVFHLTASDFARAEHGSWLAEATYRLKPSPFSNLTDCTPLAGWYWWACFPGHLPEGDPHGPFASEAEALADAREGVDDEDAE